MAVGVSAGVLMIVIFTIVIIVAIVKKSMDKFYNNVIHMYTSDVKY